MISGDNAVEIFTDGNDKFDALIEDIKNAESYIFLQYYIIKDDVLFQRIREALLEKAAQGDIPPTAAQIAARQRK